MGYDSNTGKYTFDFDSVDFPIHLSENLINYLYIKYKGNHLHYTSIEEFKNILAGNSRTQNACSILSSLCSTYNGHRVLPPKEFEILSDEIINTEQIKSLGFISIYEETHNGVCKFDELIFDFEYKVKNTHTIFEEIDFVEQKLENTTVILRGHTFQVTSGYMHEACSSYLQKEKEYEDNLIRNQIFEDERKKWVEFRLKHKQELIDWMSPIIENKIRCSKVINPIKGGYANYRLVESLDRGFCNECRKQCRVKDVVLNRGAHSEKWFELGIDKLNFKYLSECGNYMYIIK